MKPGPRIAWLVVLALFIAGFVALRAAGDLDYWRRYLAAMARGNPEPDAAQINPRIVVEGAEGGALPVATPEAEGIYPEAIAEAQKAAQQQGAGALLVHRHGHRVSTWFADGKDGSTLVPGGDLSPMLLVLATGALADARQIEFTQAVANIRNATLHAQDDWRNPWSAEAHSRFTLSGPPAYLMKDLEGTLANTLSLRVWQPLGAGDAWLWGVDSSLRLDCCVVARVDDWMRVADLILRNGEYEGNRIVSADWMRHVLAFDAEGVAHPVWVTPSAFSGDEPPAARETFWFDLGPDLRLWLLPRRGLSILHWSASGTGRSRDTTIPNIIIRGMAEQQLTPGATELRDIVPGH